MARGRNIVRKITIDFVALLVVGLLVLLFWLFGEPFKRGFFCNDESLYHPYRESTVTGVMLYLTGICLPIFTMMVGEFIHSKRNKGQSAMVLFGYTIPPWVWMAYTKIGVFGFGAASTALATDVAKYTIGRLRPHFMEMCVPNVNCSLAENQHRYIEAFECTNSATTARLIKETRLSFPSGHSSFSAYTMVYLALYLQVRFIWRGSKLLKHLLQFICLGMAWYTAMTRVSNYKHHWSDVLAGSTLGTLTAILVANCIGDLFSEESSHSGPNKHRTETDRDTEEGTQVNNGTANNIC